MTEVYVQVLLIIPPAEDTYGQNQSSSGKVLLCKWIDGAFQDRYTGLIKLVDCLSENKKSDLIHMAKAIIPSALQQKLKKLDLVGILKFDGPPESEEYIFLATINAMTFKHIEETKFESHPCFWYDWDKIPYDNMPADDAIWYPRVLFKGEKICGSFNFGGWSERTIKSYELQAVDNVEIL